MKRYDFRGDAFRAGAVLVAALALLGTILRGPAARSLAQIDTFTLLPGLMPGLAALCQRVGGLALALSTSMVLVYMVYWCIFHKVYKGFQYAFRHALLYHNIRVALLEAGTLYAVGEEKGRVTLPKIRLILDDDAQSGRIELRDKPVFGGKLQSLNLSSSLGRFRTISSPYITKDDNWVVHRFIDAKAATRLVFADIAALRAEVGQVGDYNLALDKRNNVHLTSAIICGLPGSGKSYALYGMLLQALCWSHPAQLYFADPKESGLGVLGNILAPDRSVMDIDGIIALLETFGAELEKREHENYELLKDEIDADYRDFGLTPHIFIFDELAAFMSMLDREQSKRVTALLRQVVLKGRQLGFFVWLVMQKSKADDLDTSIRDCLALKVVLGNAPNLVYQTLFEHYADIPKRDFAEGEGLFNFNEGEVQEVAFPTLNFSVVKEVKEMGAPVM